MLELRTVDELYDDWRAFFLFGLEKRGVLKRLVS